MTIIGWEKRVNDLRQEVALIRSRAHLCSGRFQESQRQAESCKVQFLIYQLDAKCNFLARTRGVASVTKNGKGLLPTLAITTGAFLLTGIATKDWHTAADGGLSGLKGALQGLGETEWAVCLGKRVLVVSRDKITPGRVWLTLDSVRAALNELEQKAQNGALLGNLDAVFLEVLRSKKVVSIEGQSAGQVETVG